MIAQFPSEVAQRIYDILNDNLVALLGPDAMIFYGDQRRVPVTPTVCVESGPTDRRLAGVPQRTENELECYILVYWAKVQDVQANKLESEQCAETLARFLDGNLNLERAGDGGIVIHGYVTRIDPGYSYRGGDRKDLYQTVRLTWNGKTKTMLGA